MKLFNLDSPLMQALSRMADLMWLNILTMICCIPIFTIGPALTAMHYMCLKMARNEETYVTQGYFKSFKENFKQGVCIWLIHLVVLAVVVVDMYIMFTAAEPLNIVVQIVIYLVAFLVILTSTFLYPLFAKFVNTTKATIKNSFLIGIMQFPKTILMIVMNFIPPIAFIMFPQVIPLVLFFGLSLPAYLGAKLYNGFFQRLEDQYMEANGLYEEESEEEDERIFKDELDPALAVGEENQQ